MSRFIGLLLLAVCATAQVDAGDGIPPESARPETLDPSFWFGETNLSAVLDLELFPDGRIGYAGMDKAGGVTKTIGVATPSGGLLQPNFGGSLLSEGRSVAIEPRELIMYGAGVPLDAASTNVFDGPTRKIVGNGDWRPWNLQAGVIGVANEVRVLADRQVLAAGRLRSIDNLEQTNGFLRHDLNGRVDTNWNAIGSADLEVTTFEILEDGKILGAYQITNEAGVLEHGIGRWHTNGNRDLSYPVVLEMELNARVTALRKVRGGQNVVMAVQAAEADGAAVSRLILLDELGETAAENSLSEVTIDGVVKALAFECTNAGTLSAGGFDRIILGGEFTRIGRDDCKNLAAVTGGGVVAWCFGTTNGPNAAVETVEMQHDGKLLIGGSFTSVGGTPANGAARLLGSWAEGANYLFWGDTEFRGFERSGEAELVLGRRGGTNEPLTVSLAVLNQETTAGDFEVPARVVFAPGEEVAAVTIRIRNDALRENREVFRLRASVTNETVLVTRAETELVVLDDETPGTLSPENLAQAPPFMRPIAVQLDGKILAASGANIVRFERNGRVDETFVTNGLPNLGGVGEIRQIEPQADGKIYVAGKFHTTAANPGINHVARLNPDGTLDQTFDPRLRPGSTFSTRDMAAMEVLDDGNVVIWTSGTVRTGFGLGGMFLVSATGAGIRQYSGVYTWSGEAKIEHLATGEVFAYGDGPSYRQLPKFKTNGVTDTNFVARISGSVHVMEAAEDSLYVAGDIESVNGTPVGFIAKLDVITGSLDTNWNVRVNGRVVALEITETNIYISGEFSEVNGQERFRLARLNLDGTLDERFDPGLGPVVPAWFLHEESDGKLLFASSGGRVDRLPVPMLARAESGLGSVEAERGIIEIGRGEHELEVRYSGGRLEESIDLERWVEIHTGGGAYRPIGDEPMRFYRAISP